MEPLTQPADQQSEEVGNPKRRWRWWLIIPFLILSMFVVLAVLVFANPSITQYQFLSATKPVFSRETIMHQVPGGEVFSQFHAYRSDQFFETLAGQVKQELMPLGFTAAITPASMIGFENREQGIQVGVEKGEGRVFIYISQKREVTIFDRSRFWVKDRLPSLFPEPDGSGLP